MQYVRWIGVVLLVLVMGFLGFFGLFADGGVGSRVIIGLLFLAAGVGVGALIPGRWYLSVLGSWGALSLVAPELAFRIGREPVDGQQPLFQVILTGGTAIVVALVSGFIGGRLRSL